MATSKTFADQLSRAEKSKRGRTDVTSTPLAIRSRVPLEPIERERIRSLLGRKLAKYATHIERATIRIDDVNGPRGGVDTLCKIKIVISGSPSIVVEERGVVVEDVVVVAARVAARAVRREVERRGRSAAKPKRGEPARPAARAAVGPQADDDGSLIGRRVGRSREQLERALLRPEKERGDAYVDTSAPGKSASDRKVGYGATARRNTKRNTKGLTSALEDSRTTPSRKSTRKSGNRARASSPLELRERLRRASPKSNAARARAARRGKRPR